MRMAQRVVKSRVRRPLGALRETSHAAILLLVVMVLCSACGATPRAVTTAAASPFPPLVIYAATARVQSGTHMSVSASCRSGERMLGGGFGASDLFEYAAYIEASYPTDVTTWSVTASAPASYFDLEVDVYCVPTTFALGLHVVQATGVAMATVACPQDTVLLGGGFQSSEPITVSRAQGNGWLARTWDASIHVYALCAAHHVLQDQAVSAVFNPHSTSHDYAPSGGEAACPAGTIAVGGGFAGEDLIVGSLTRGPSFAGWSVMAGGDADVTVSAVCVRLHA